MPNQRPNSARLLNYAKQMRKEPSDAERKLWQELRNRKLDNLKFRRQMPIGPFIADFACEEVHLVVELDGEQHDQAVEYDEQRTTYLNDAGWRVIRFSTSDAVKHVDFVLRSILLHARPSP